MASRAFSGQGTIIARSDDIATPVFVDIAEIKSITGPGGASTTLDTTTLSSAAKEFVPGLKDNGEVTLSVNFVPGDAGQQQMIEDQENLTMAIYRITYSDKRPTGGTTATFNAYVTNFAPSVGVDALSTADVSLRVSGGVTWVFATLT
jgi:hypothetical protein